MGTAKWLAAIEGDLTTPVKINHSSSPCHPPSFCAAKINIMARQCLDRRLDSQALIAREVAAWEKERNTRRAKIHWTFTLASARRKLRKLYPSIED